MSVAGAPEPVPTAQPLTHGLRLEGARSAEPATDEWSEENFFRVVLNVEGGDWVEVATFPDEEAAEACARDLVGQLANRAWPRVKSRNLRTESILSVEVSERRRYTGSAARRGFAADA